MRRSVFAIALVVAACGGSAPAPSLSADQLSWCPAHSMTPLKTVAASSPYVDDLVIQAAGNNKIAIPNSVARANSTFITVNLTGNQSLLTSVPTTWEQDLKTWETTADWANACTIAYAAK